MSLNVTKSACIRVGARFNIDCSGIVTKQGCELSWVESIRYLGIYLVAASSFKCSLDNAKRSFYRSFNAIFGEVGRIASSGVIVQLNAPNTFQAPAMYYVRRPVSYVSHSLNLRY